MKKIMLSNVTSHRRGRDYEVVFDFDHAPIFYEMGYGNG